MQGVYMKLTSTIFILISLIVLIKSQDYYFPDDFKFGAATSAFQVEGGWNADGKGENIWDVGIREHPDYIANQVNAEIACDSYHKYKEDVQLLKDIGVHFYRFSISWSRILPTGKVDNINQAGIDYYNNLINELLANGIEPYVTIFHWDLPQPLQDEFGGWPNRVLADYYVDYARIVFQNFGDRVKTWMTFNEILQFCEDGYGSGTFAPFINNPGIGGYECTHTVLIAHGRAYHMYEQEFKPSQNGRIGIAIDTYWHEPNIPDSEWDQQAAERCIQMNYGWFTNPIMLGNYPQIMIDRIRDVSLSEGFEISRLPEFTQEEIDNIRGTYDFLGLNHYTSDRSFFADEGAGDHPSHWADVGVIGVEDNDMADNEGLQKLLVWIKNNYNNPPLLITENGSPNGNGYEDGERITYLRNFLSQILKAINEDGCNVIGYTVWSVMDNFEWLSGYSATFGLSIVDFNDDNRPRTRRQSSFVYNNIITTKHIDWNYVPPTYSESNTTMA